MPSTPARRTTPSCLRRRRIAIVAACVALPFVSIVSGAPGQPRLAPSPVKPIDAALVLLEGACLPLVGRKDLHLRIETDWLPISDWKSPAELSTRLIGRPFALTVAEHRVEVPRRNIVATAEVWLTSQGDLLTFRLGPGSLVETPADAALKRDANDLVEPSEPNVNRLLVDRGARLPAHDSAPARRRAEAFLRSIRALVGEAAVQEVEFAPMPARRSNKAPWEDDSKPPALDLYWSIRASASTGDLDLTLDAISGHVIAVSQSPR
jgi:hypothetical protein